MKKHPFILSIPTPCHESWTDMTPVEKGRFCKSCQQAVTDFTSMSDQQIIAFLKRHPGSHCGRFLPDQLNTPIQTLSQARQRFIPAAILAGFTGLLALFNQQTKAAEKEKNVRQQSQIVITADEPIKSTPLADDSIYIRGRTFIQDGGQKDTLMSATIRIKDTNIGAVSDLHGFFQLRLPENAYSGEVRLIIQAVGMRTQEVHVQLDQKSLSKELVVVMETYATTGLMIVYKNGKPVHSDNSLRGRLCRLFSRR